MFDKDLKPPFVPPSDKIVSEKEIEEIAKKEVHFFAEYKVIIKKIILFFGFLFIFRKKSNYNLYENVSLCLVLIKFILFF